MQTRLMKHRKMMQKETQNRATQYQMVAEYRQRKRRPKLGRSTPILELIAGGLAATTAIHKGEPDQTVPDHPRQPDRHPRADDLSGGPWIRSE
jgi:hypothetical protein